MQGSVPVNVKETDTAFEMEVIAPGYEKSDFTINLENDLLTISAERKEEVKKENEKLKQTKPLRLDKWTKLFRKLCRTC